ncbi:hypothetical protein LOAG_14764, partial [Loa loa]
VLEARFEQTTQSEHDEIEWTPEDDMGEMQEQKVFDKMKFFRSSPEYRAIEKRKCDEFSS